MRKLCFLIPFIIAAAVLVFGGAVMYLWNSVLTPVLGVTTITFWQAVGLLILSKLLFGGFHCGRRHFKSGPPFLHHRWKHMSDTEREQLKQEWRSRWGCCDTAAPGDSGEGK
jgi:Ca2+/H+ antiporter, TMEM165/GDT1 family